MKLKPGHRVKIYPQTWAAAWQLGLLRKSSRSNRTASQDRGSDRNVKNDVSGAVSELITLRLAWERGYEKGARIIASNLYMPMLRKVSDTPWFDIKTTIHEPTRRRVLVNAEQHAKSCYDYTFFRLAWLGSEAVVSRLVRHDEVSSWPVVDFGYGSPAHSIWFDDFCQEFMAGETPSDVRVSRSDIALKAGEAKSALMRSIEWGMGVDLSATIP